MADAEDHETSFLTRWSDRKLQARTGVESGETPSQAGGPNPAEAATTEDSPEVPMLTDADMPPLESLDEGSDYSGFLSPGVSEELRRKALGKLFHSAGFNLVDGLDDYDDDFTGFLPLGDIVTSDMRHRMEEAAKRLLAEDKDAVETEESVKEGGGEAVCEPVATPQSVRSDHDGDGTDGEPV